MITRTDIPAFMDVGMKTNFMMGFEGVDSIYEKVCMTITSDKDEEKYPFLGATAGLREWKTERQHKDIAEYSFTIVNKDYEDTISVSRNAIDDNQYKQYFTQALSMGAEVARSYDVIFAAHVEAGTSTTCYDGQYFFDTDHSSKNSGTQSNYDNSIALSATNAKTAITAMQSFKDDQGVVMGANPTHVMVPTGLGFTAMEVFNPAPLSAGATEPDEKVLSGWLQVIVNPYMTTNATPSISNWILLDLSKPVKPFVFQNRKPATFEVMDSGDDAFERNIIKYGVHARFAYGYGEWRYAYLCNDTN
jgi:phage major head subunit gpT-like protein